MRTVVLTLLLALAFQDAVRAQEDPRPESKAKTRIRVRVRYRGTGKAPARVALRLDVADHGWPPSARKSRDPLRPPPVFPELRGSDGVVEARIPVPGRYQVVSIVADGHVHSFPNLRLDLQDGADLLVLLDRPRTSVLRVVDAHSGLPLPGARIYQHTHRNKKYPSPFGDHALFPNAFTLAERPGIADSAGRLTLRAETAIRQLHVVADGYAWKPVHVLPSMGGEAVVKLLRGGTVRLHVTRWKDLLKPCLRAYCENPKLDTNAPLPNESGDVLVRGVPAGRIRFEVTGRARQPKVLYGSGAVEVVPGATVDLTIHPTPPARHSGTAVSGTLRVPAAWRWAGGHVTLSLRGIGPTCVHACEQLVLEVGASGRVARFAAGRLPRGPYQLWVGPFGWLTELRVSAGPVQLALVVPEPAMAALRVVDAVTGEDLPAATLCCSIPGSCALRSPRDDSGRFLVRTAAPRIDVVAGAPGYGWLDRTIDLSRQETTAVTLSMQRGGDLVARLRLEGQPIGGNGIRAYMSLKGANREYRLSEYDAEAFCQGVAMYRWLREGTWILGVQELAGIEPVSRTVEIRSGETTEIEIDLRRAQ